MNSFFGPYFRFARWLLRLALPGSVSDSSGIKHNEPAVYVAHHQDLQGPFFSMLWSIRPLHAWSLSIFLDQKECYKQYAGFTFPVRLKWPKLLAKIVVYPLSFIVSRLMRSGGMIPVYRGQTQIRKTFEQTIDALLKGEAVAVFPDIDYSNKDHAIGEIYEGFLTVDRLYFKKTGTHVPFVPMCADRRGKTLKIGEPVMFTGDVPFGAEKSEVAERICAAINELSESKPR